MNTAVVISLVGLIVVVAVHIAVIARWSGRIDGYMASTADRLGKAESEIVRLRERTHKVEGGVQRHEGMLRLLGVDRREPIEES